MRREWLTGLIRELHIASRGTYGYRWVHAELTIGTDVSVSSRLVFTLMHDAGLHGPPGPTRVKRLRGVVTSDDIVNRKFHRMKANELWVIEFTQHRTREGWLYCCCVLDALDMAIKTRDPAPGGIVHADHGPQFTSWAFGNRIRAAGLMPSFGSVGDGLSNAMMESFWSSTQIELLDRQRWNTRVELANAIFE